MSGYRIRGTAKINPTLEECAAEYQPGDKILRIDANGQERDLSGKEIDEGAAAFLRATMMQRRKEQRNAQ